jgi:hypothetical protein
MDIYHPGKPPLKDNKIIFFNKVKIEIFIKEYPNGFSMGTNIRSLVLLPDGNVVFNTLL